MSEELDETLTDKLTSIATVFVKNTTSLLLPTFGPLIGEIVGTLIPNQRINRIAEYVKVLDAKLSLIPIERLNLLLQNEGLINLLEDGFIQAARATTNERREYISAIVVAGVDDEVIKYSESQTMLRLLQELSDVEVIWLRYHAFDNTAAYNEFHRLHRELFTYVRVDSRADEDAIRKEALKAESRNHLERLGLIRLQQNLNPYIYNVFHRQRIAPQGYESTKLGRVLLKQLGLIDNITLSS